MRKLNYKIYKNILLTGAGFTKNFGGFLAKEMWQQILNHKSVQNQERIVKILENDFNYESVYYKVVEGEEYTQEEKNAIIEAVEDAYKNLDNIIRKFRTNFNKVDIYKIYEMLKWFEGKQQSKGFFFTLNQDLFIERHCFPAIKPVIPGIPKNDKWLGGNSTAPLENSDFITLPSNLDSIESSLSNGRFFYIKLHGSQNWRSHNGTNLMVIGRKKVDRISEEPLLSWYFTIFKEVLAQEKRRLLIIGYGFNDEHINEIIAKSRNKHNLELVIISPDSPKNFKQNLKKKPYGDEIWSGCRSLYYFCGALYSIIPYNYYVGETPDYHQLKNIFLTI